MIGCGIDRPGEMLVLGNIRREIWREEEAVFGRADCRGAEAGGGGPVRATWAEIRISLVLLRPEPNSNITFSIYDAL
jgi:hypothetical protein